MGRRKKQPGVTITRENLLYQPLALAVNGYEATALQQNTVIAILHKLRESIKELRDGQYKQPNRQLSLFDIDGVKRNFLKKGDLVFDLHMRDLGVEPRHYPVAFDTLCKMGSAMVWVPVEEKGVKKLMMDNLFNIVTENIEKIQDPVSGAITYRYTNRNPTCTVVVPRHVAEMLFPADKRITDFLEPTALMISEKSPKRIYMYLSTFKNRPEGYTVDYWKFRHDIGFNDENAPIDKATRERKIQYPYYSYFHKFVLKPSMEKLRLLSEQQQCDFWFEVKPIYDRPGRAKNPDRLHFIFHMSDLGENIRSEKMNLRREIELEMSMLDKLMLTRQQVVKLMNRVREVDARQALGQKIEGLIRELERNRERPISNVGAWAFASLNNFLDQYAAGEIVPNRTNEAAAETPKEAVVVEKVCFDAEEIEDWNHFLRVIRRESDAQFYDTFWTCNEYDGLFVDANDKVEYLHIKVPSKYVMERLEAESLNAMRIAMAEVYGRPVGVKYKFPMC